MMALDSSALVAIALGEPEAELFANAISEHRCFLGWPTLFETYIVLRHRVGPAEIPFLRTLGTRPNIAQVNFDERLFDVACSAFDRYGKRRSRGGLNFGDCMAYAVAKIHDVPLLFKGDDFRLTDIRPAVP